MKIIFDSKAEPSKEEVSPIVIALFIVAILWAIFWGGIFYLLFNLTP